MCAEIYQQLKQNIHEKGLSTGVAMRAALLGPGIGGDRSRYSRAGHGGRRLQARERTSVLAMDAAASGALR